MGSAKSLGGPTARNVRSGCGGYRGLALKDNDAVGQVCRHDEVMLDNERGLLGVQNEPEKAIKLG